MFTKDVSMEYNTTFTLYSRSLNGLFLSFNCARKCLLRYIDLKDYINVFHKFLIVNLAHESSQKLQGEARMSGRAQNSNWTADKAVDGNTNQSYLSNSCAIMDFIYHYVHVSVWWKVRLVHRFNIAYIELFLRSDSKYGEQFHSIFEILYTIGIKSRYIACLKHKNIRSLIKKTKKKTKRIVKLNIIVILMGLFLFCIVM